jgi:peroxiredoxin
MCRRGDLVPDRTRLRIILLLPLLLPSIGLAGCEGQKESNPGIKESQASGTKKPTASPKQGFLAPGFSLPDLAGAQVSLEEFRGQVVLLNFWATWCAPCRREIPSLIRLYQLRKDKELEIVAVSVDRASPSKVVSFVTDHQMSFPVLTDPRGEVGSKYWIRSVPTSFLVDSKGVIRWKVIGAIEWDEAGVLTKIDQLISE